MTILWSFGDALRKWGGLNQPVYLLQMLSPLLCFSYLYIKRLVRPSKTINVLALCILAFSFPTALFYSIHAYSYRYILVWFLSFVALVFPFLLVSIDTFGTARASSMISHGFIYKTFNFILIVLVLNNVLSIYQSFSAALDPVNVGAGGLYGLQLDTSSDIAIRAPGLFTFISGNALFNTFCLLLLLCLGTTAINSISILLYSLALFSIPVVIIRSISRSFAVYVFLLLSVFSLRSFAYKRFFFSVLGLSTISLFAILMSPDLSYLIYDGIENFQARLDVSEGVIEGIVVRFFVSIIHDYHGINPSSLVLAWPSWFADDPFGALFGLGLGHHSNLFRSVVDQISGSSAYSFSYVSISGEKYLTGEVPLGSLLSDFGLIGLSLYIIFVLICFRDFWRKYLAPFISSGSAVLACFFVLPVIISTLVYTRPFFVLFVSLVMLIPHFCCHAPSGPWRCTPYTKSAHFRIH